MPELFIGLVSHKASRFAWNQGEEGLARSLQRLLTQRGVECEIRINTENLLDGSTLPLTSDVIWDSAMSELKLEFEWLTFLNRGPGESRDLNLRRNLTHIGRRAATAWKLRGPTALTKSSFTSEVNALRRLLNIEMSHFDLLDRAIDSGADWALILEDDASTLNLDDAVSGVLGLMALSHADQPKYVNVSQSFTKEQLGVTQLLISSAVSWNGEDLRGVYPSIRPISNTVCAILYRRSFLIRLRAVMAELPQIPVIPIDWKLNQALMTMSESGELVDGDCWTVFPGPFDQLSMRANAEEVVGRS
jgi:hypothetical protein